MQVKAKPACQSEIRALIQSHSLNKTAHPRLVKLTRALTVNMSRALSVGGQGSVPRVDDVVAVACNDVVVTLDSSNLNRIKKESPAPKAFVREEPGETVVTGDADRLANNVSRAGIYCALIRLVYGSSTCRPVVLQALEGFLREGGGDVSLPKARGDTDALAAIPGALAGHSTAVSLSDDAVSNAVPGGQAPGYSKVERLQLLSGSPITCGALAIATVQLRSALHANSVSLAMSCEALKASTAMFADSKLPNISASKYVADVSRDIVALLDGSSFVNAKPKDGGIGSTQPVVKVQLLRLSELALFPHCLHGPVAVHVLV